MFFKVILRLLSFLPLAWLQGLGAFFGRMYFRMDKRYAKRTRVNAQQAGYADESFASSAAEHAGRGALELAYFWTPRVHGLLNQVQIFGWEEVAAVLQQRKGILLLTPHIGAFELLSLWLGTKTDLVAMYRPPNVAALNAVMLSGRERNGVQMASSDIKGIRVLLRHLKNGGMTGILPDQVPAVGADGVVVNVFGKRAWTMTLPAKLVAQSKAQLLVAYAVRTLDKARPFALHFELVKTPLTGDVQSDTEQINQWMEAVIRQYPEQYLWSYNRYKHTPTEEQLLAKLEKSNGKKTAE